MKYTVRKKEYFEHGNYKYRVKYVKTHFDFRWISVERKLFWCFYIGAGIYGAPEELLEYLNKVETIIKKLDTEAI